MSTPRILSGGARVGGVRLVQVPAERAVDERLGRERAQPPGEDARRRGGHETLQRQRAAEGGAVALVEGGVAAQGLVALLLARDDLRDLAAGRDPEVERGADPLAAEREAVAGAVAGEEDAALDGSTQAVREPVALVADNVGVQAPGERDGRLLDVATRVVGADADAGLAARGHAPAVARADEVALDPDVEGIAFAVAVRVRMDLEAAAERRLGRLVVRAREHAAPAERVDDQRGVERAAVGAHGVPVVARAALDLG